MELQTDTRVQADKAQIRLLIDRINDAWLKGPPEQIPAAMEDCFHNQMVIRGGPDFQLMAGGKAACIQSYTDFLRQASVRACTLSEPQIDVSGDTAVAICPWDMTYELNGQEYRESGHDMFILSRVDGKWTAVWRALLPASSR